MDTCRGDRLWFLVLPVLVPAEVSFIHGKAEKEEAQQLDLQLPVLRKSQRLVALRLVSLWVPDPFLVAYGSFAALPLFPAEETGRLRPAGPACAG